jgi:hypothetical protein
MRVRQHIQVMLLRALYLYRAGMVHKNEGANHPFFTEWKNTAYGHIWSDKGSAGVYYYFRHGKLI